jgi:hypothetical protein
MSQFMQPQIVFDEWLIVDGADGVETIPADLIGGVAWMKLGTVYDTDCLEEDSDMRRLLGALEAYVEGFVDDVASVERVEGFGARLSAPGFMDCTQWTVHKTREEAEAYLRDMYDVEDDEEEVE